MPVWLKGNNVFTSSNIAHDLLAGSLSEQLPLEIGGDAYTSKYTVVWQPGILKGVNIYVAVNTSTNDVNYQFHKDTWSVSGDSYGGQVNTTLFTVPAGETGYFCFDPTDVAESTRTWAARDRVGIRLVRSGTTGDMKGVTIGVCVEYTEEDLVDNSGTNNPVGTVIDAGGY